MKHETQIGMKVIKTQLIGLSTRALPGFALLSLLFLVALVAKWRVVHLATDTHAS